jgi:hypothetical protein
MMGEQVSSDEAADRAFFGTARLGLVGDIDIHSR